MIGYLIYDQEGKKRNEWFISRLIEVFFDNGINLKVVLDSEYKNLPLPDFAVVRCINASINKYYEEKGVAVFNNSSVSEVANDKYKTYLLAKRLDVPVMETQLLSDFDEEKFGSEPFVVKSRNGHGGKQVYLVKSKKDYDEIKIAGKDNYIVQKVTDTLGVDTRVYFLDNRVIAVIKRTSTIDFRSNFSLGGNAEKVEITEAQNQIVKKIANELNPTFIGIDFVFNNGEWVLNEIEDPVGCRMIYKTCDFDVVKDYVKSVLKALKR